MTKDDVRKAIEAIRGLAESGDHEVAHSSEDVLYEDVLTAIAASDCIDAADLAQAALETKTINFHRWCA